MKYKYKHCKDCYYRSNQLFKRKLVCKDCTSNDTFSKDSNYSYKNYEYVGTYDEAVKLAAKFPHPR